MVFLEVVEDLFLNLRFERRHPHPEHHHENVAPLLPRQVQGHDVAVVVAEKAVLLDQRLPIRFLRLQPAGDAAPLRARERGQGQQREETAGDETLHLKER